MDVSDSNGGSGGNDATRTMYYINDGLYGSFNCVLYDHATVACEVVHRGTVATSVGTTVTDDGKSAGGERACSVWGPTCDGIDCVLHDAKLPELQVGAWLAFRDMGAYTACAGSNFNGMALPDAVYLQAASGQEAKPMLAQDAAESMLKQMGALAGGK